MAKKCLNTSLPEVREQLNKLYREAGATNVIDKIDIDNRVALWQEANNTDEFPENVAQIYKPTLLQKNLIDQIRENFDELGVKTQDLVDNFVEVYRKETLNLENNPLLQRLRNQFVAQNGLEDFKAIRSRLNRVIEQLEDEQKFKKGLQSFAKGLQSMKYITGVMYEDLKAIKVEKTQITEEELKRIWQYFNIVNEFSSLTKRLTEDGLTAEFLTDINSDLNKSASIIYSLKEAGVVAALSPEFNSFKEKIDEYYENKLQELETKKKNTKSDANRKGYEKRIKEIKAEREKYQLNSNELINWLRGEKGDSSLIEMLSRAAILSSDPIVSSFKKNIIDEYDKSNNETKQFAIPFQQELAVYEKTLQKYGIDFRRNPESFFKELTQVVERKDENEDYSELWYLHEFTSQIYTDRDNLEKDVILAQKEYREALQKDENVKETKKKLKEAKRKLSTHLNDYWFQEAAPQVNERYKLFDDEVGQALKERIDDIFEDIQDLQYTINDQSIIDPTAEERIQLDNLWRQYNLLSSERNMDGTHKIGVELLIAQRAKQYKEETRKFYQYTTDQKAFDKARQKFIEQLEFEQKTEEEIATLLAEWDKQNTKREATKEYWDLINQKTIELNNYLNDVKKKREQALEKLKENPKLYSQLKTSFDNLLNLSELYQELRKQTEGLKDESNEVVGNLISQEKAQVIKDVQLKIESTKSALEKLSGLTQSEQKELSDYYKQIKSKIKLNPSQQDRFDELKDKKSQLGIDSKTKDKIVELIQEINALQTKIPTSYYLDAFNQLSVDVKITEENADEVINSPTLNTLLENDIFEKWFRDNHIKVSKFNLNTKEYEEKWERLNFWTATIPSVEEFIENKPSRAYTKRELKPEYIIKKVEGFTVDNKGNWLPKGYNKRNELIAKDDKYLNSEYYRLKNATNELEATKFKILELIKNKQLEIQKEQPDGNKIWLRVPSVERKTQSFLQSLFSQDAAKKLKELPSFIWTKLKDSFKINETDINDGTLNANTITKSVKTDYYGNQLITVPIRFIGTSIPVENISLSLPSNVVYYAYSLNLNRNLSSLIPTAEFLKQILEQNKPVEKGKASYIKTYSRKLGGFIKKPVSVKSESNTRLAQIQSIIDNDLKGQTNVIQWDRFDKFMEFGFNLASLPLVKPTGGIVNWFTGKFNQAFLGLEGVYYSIPQFVQGNHDFLKNYFPTMLKDLYDNKLGEYSLQTQLILNFDPQQDYHTLDRFDKKGVLAYGLRRFMMSIREYGEKEITYSTLVTMMNNEMVKTKDDSLIPLSQAYELKNGLLSLKDDVLLTDQQLSNFKNRVRTALQIAQGNYAKIDKTHSERYTLGRIAFFMKKYLIPLYIRTWGDRSRDISTGIRDEGYYRSALKQFFRFFKDVFTSLYNKENSITPITIEEKVNLYQATLITSLSILNHVIGSFIMQSVGGDDEDDLKRYKLVSLLPWQVQYLYLLMYRFVSEIESLTPFGGYNEIMRNLREPFGVILSPLRKGYKLGESVLYETLDLLADIFDNEDIRPKPVKLRYEDQYSKRYQETFGTDRKLYINAIKLSTPYDDAIVDPANAIVNYTTAAERIKQ